MSNVKVIGLCGRSGSGKGFVCEAFLRFGIPSVDTDKVYREIISEKDSPCLKELSEEFGSEILNGEGALDRRALAKIVFASGAEKKLQKLNGITHKYILEKTLSIIEKHEKDGKRAVVVDAPVLFESSFDKICHITVCVTAPDEVCVQRICRRDNISEEDATARLSKQIGNCELLSRCGFSILNDGVSDVTSQVGKLLNECGIGGIDEE